ncbi:MAG: hypothetical protein KC462_05875 [Cyanobacteria bacterium HKST-UBA05]|nr:hypothetical protein [Cyanobacteria bacterium HKST-UBA05]
MLAGGLLFGFGAVHAESDPVTLTGRVERVAAQNDHELVYYNTQSGKYHIPSCRWARQCTKHCIPIKRQVAKQRGGVPCKVCGGGG